MSTQPANLSPNINAVYEPYAAAAWLVNRHPTIAELLGRMDLWTGNESDEGKEVHLRHLAEAINDAEQYGAAWKLYEEERPAPFYDEDDPKQAALYDAWEQAGPSHSNPRAAAFGPMSGGEKRMLRMLAILAPSTPVRFNLAYTADVDQGYRDDWRRLVAGFGVR
jgi:hypothetical protein